MDPSFYRFTTVARGFTYRYYIRSTSDHPTKPTALFLHGFPSSSQDWRKVVPSFEERGYPVIVPDMLGYGGTDKPHCSYTSPSTYSPYSPKSLCADLAALLDFVGVEKAIVMGHDWGALVAWRFGMYYSGRVEGLVA